MALKESFELLHEIGNLFVVRYGSRTENGESRLTLSNRPNAIKERMRDGVLTKVKPQLLKPYLMRRDDYTSAGIEKIVSISVSGHWTPSGMANR